MEEKKPIKIKLSTAIFLIIILVLLGGILYLILQNKNYTTKQHQGEPEKQAVQDNEQITENTIVEENNTITNTITDKVENNTITNTITDKAENNTITNTITDIVENNTDSIEENKTENAVKDKVDNKTANEKILEELKERRFLAKNRISIDSKVRYVSLNNSENPLYIVHIEHERFDNDSNQSTYFFITYKDGSVIFDKALQHKYEYELFYEESTMTIKAKLAYKGVIRTIYGEIKDGEYKELDEFVEPSSEETSKFLINQKEVSKAEFNKAKEKYENKKYISFSEKAKILE